MPSLVDYNPHYRRGERLFGAPLRELVRLLDEVEARAGPTSVLDLGCGQGRNALFAARRGHEIVGVDLAKVGVEQMVSDARAAGLAVTGVSADILAFRSRRRFGVVLLDRVLHLLPSDADRRFLLGRLAAFTRLGGFALVTTTARHRALVHGFFAQHAALRTVCHEKASFVCARRGS